MTTSTTDEDCWYEFRAYNSQSHYGYGSEKEADRYCNILNRGRRQNLYGYSAMDPADTTKLDSGDDTDGFRLDDALQAQDEIDADIADDVA